MQLCIYAWYSWWFLKYWWRVCLPPKCRTPLQVHISDVLQSCSILRHGIERLRFRVFSEDSSPPQIEKWDRRAAWYIFFRITDHFRSLVPYLQQFSVATLIPFDRLRFICLFTHTAAAGFTRGRKNSLFGSDVKIRGTGISRCREYPLNSAVFESATRQ